MHEYFPRKSKISMYAAAHSCELLSNASQIIIIVSTTHHKLHRGPLTPLLNYTHLTTHPHFVDVIFSIIFINGVKKGCKPWELKYPIMLLRAGGKKGYIQCLNLLLLLCFLYNELQHTYQILISSEDKQEHTYEFQRVQPSSRNTVPSVLPSWASFKFWLQLFIMSHRKTTKCWSELGK